MDEYFYTCPYCHQAVSTLIELGIDGHTSVVDDCEVCCRPIEFDYYVEDYQITSISYQAIEGNEF